MDVSFSDIVSPITSVDESVSCYSVIGKKCLGMKRTIPQIEDQFGLALRRGLRICAAKRDVDYLSIAKAEAALEMP